MALAYVRRREAYIMQRAMRILVVEDDPSTAGLLALWLTKAGFVVEVDHSA